MSRVVGIKTTQDKNKLVNGSQRKEFDYQEAYEKLLKAFLKAFELYQKEGGDLRNLRWNDFDDFFFDMHSDPEDRLVLENVKIAWEKYKKEKQEK